MPSERMGRSLPPKEILQHFSDLASLTEQVRTNAAIHLLNHISPLHQSHVSESKDTANAPPNENELDDAMTGNDATASAKSVLSALASTLHPDVYYTLTRLVKGLPSSRLAARQGFSLALTLVIQLTFPNLQYFHLKAAVQSLIICAPSDSSIDLRERLYGRMFVILSCIESGLVRVASEHDVVDMVDVLIDVAHSKSYLRESAFQLAFRIVDNTTHKQAVLSTLQKALPNDIDHVDHLAMCLFLDIHQVSNLPLTLSTQILSPNSAIADWILQAASVAPRLHIVWPVILAKVLQLSSPLEIGGSGSTPNPSVEIVHPFLAPFWYMIDQVLLPAVSQRQVSGLLVFSLLFQSLPVSQLFNLMSFNLMRLMDSGAASMVANDEQDGSIVPHVKNAVQVMMNVAMDHPQALALVLSSIRPNTLSTFLPTLVLKCNAKDLNDSSISTVDQLWARISESNINTFVASQIVRAKDELTNLADHDGTETSILVPALEMLTHPFLASYSTARQPIGQVILSASHSASCPNASKRIQTFLTRSVPAPELHVDRLYEIYSQFPNINASVKQWIESPMWKPDSVTERKRELALRALVMGSHIMIDIDSGSDRALDMVQEIITVWQQYTTMNDVDDLHPLDVLVDISLELTSHPVAWLRRLCAVAIDAFADVMTDKALDLLLSALGDDISDQEDDFMDVDSGLSEDDDNDDVDECDDLSDDGSDTGNSAQTQLSDAILNAFHTSGMVQSKDDEMDLDDDAMLAIDGILGSMVKKPNNARHMQTERMHFKSRVIDLIILVLKKRAIIPFTYVRQLASQITENSDKQVLSKLWSAMSSIRAIDLPKNEVDNADQLARLFLKNSLGQAHPFLMKLFMVNSPSLQMITDLLLKDHKRYKSILMALVRSCPSSCAQVFSVACSKLSRKSVPHLGPIISTLIDRMATVEELKQVFPVTTFIGIFCNEMQDPSKDASLVKLAAGAFRACVKLNRDLDLWCQASESITTVPTKQAPLGLLNEIRRELLLFQAPCNKVVESCELSENDMTPRPPVSSFRQAVMSPTQSKSQSRVNSGTGGTPRHHPKRSNSLLKNVY